MSACEHPSSWRPRAAGISGCFAGDPKTDPP
jgi:hypothetical protein